MDKTLEIHVGAKDDVKGPLEAVRKSLRGLFGSFSHAQSGAASLLRTGALLGGGFIALKAAVDLAHGAFRDSLGGAIEYQSEVEGLRAALTTLGDGTAAATRRAAAFADTIEQTTDYTRGQVIAAEQLGATIGGFTGPALSTATKAAIGLSQKLGIDLKTSMELVARAAHGQTSEFTRYGVTLNKAGTAQQKFDQVIQAGLSSFSLANAQTKTLAGAWSQFKHEVSSATQDAMAPAISSLTGIATYLASAKPAIAAFGQVVGAVVTAATSVVGEFGQMIGKIFGTSAGGLTQTLLRAAYAISHWKEALAIDILAVELLFVRLANQIQYQFTVVLPAWFNWFAENWKSIFDNAAVYTMDVFKNMGTNIVKIFENLPGLISGHVDFASLWTPLQAGFKSTLAALPQIAARQRGSLEQALGSALSGAESRYKSGLSGYLAKENAHGKSGATAMPSTIPLAPGTVSVAVKHHLARHLEHARHNAESKSRSHGHSTGEFSVHAIQGPGISGVAAAFASSMQQSSAADKTAASSAKTAREATESRKILESISAALGHNPLIAGVLKGV